MTANPIKLVNQDGRIVGKEPGSNNTIPVKFESFDARVGTIKESAVLYSPGKIISSKIENISIGANSEETVLSKSASGHVLGFWARSDETFHDWRKRFYYDGEESPSFDASAIQDGIAPVSSTEYIIKHNVGGSRHLGSSYGGTYYLFQHPPRYPDSIEFALRNTTGSDHPAWAYAWVTEDLDIDTFGGFRTLSDGNVEDSIGNKEEKTLVDTEEGTKGRLRSAFVDIDKTNGNEVDLRIYTDGENTPSFELNLATIQLLANDNQFTGPSFIGTGLNHNSKEEQHHSFYFNPAALGVYSYFSNKMLVTIKNHSGKGNLDWTVIWDEEK